MGIPVARLAFRRINRRRLGWAGHPDGTPGPLESGERRADVGEVTDLGLIG
jgi:hypothetical protein